MRNSPFLASVVPVGSSFSLGKQNLSAGKKLLPKFIDSAQRQHLEWAKNKISSAKEGTRFFGTAASPAA